MDSMTPYLGFFSGYGSENPWVPLLNYTVPTPSLDAYGNLTFFSDVFQRVFKTVAAQVVKTREMSPANQTIAGIATSDVSRLMVVPLSLRVMEILLGLMGLICLALCLYDFDGLPRRSGRLASIASALAHSPQIVSRLRGGGTWSTPTFQERLGGDLFYLAPGANGFGAGISVQSRNKLVDGPASRIHTWDAPKWWYPIGEMLWYRIPLVAATLSIGIALELLLQNSNRNSGLVDLDMGGYSKYGWLYVPAATMSVIALGYGSVDWATRALHPYRELRKAKRNNLEPLLYDPFEKITAVGLPHAAMGGHFALSAGMTIALLAPLLSVVVTGLFSPGLILDTLDISLPISGWFDIRNASSDSHNYIVWDKFMPQDVIFSQAIQFNNMSFPAGTFDEFAFAKLDSNDLPIFPGNSSLHARLPAARGQINCTMHPSPPNISGNLPGAYYIPITPPEGCTAGANATAAAANSSHIYLLSTTTILQHPGYFGSWAGYAGMYWTPPSFGESDIEPDLRGPYSVCADGRQHLFFYYGYASSNKSVDSLAVLHCTPYVEAVEVDVVLALPTLEVDRSASTLPTVVEGSARPFSGPNSVPLPFQTTPDVGFFTFDAFFSALLEGVDGKPAKELMGGGNSNVNITSELMIEQMRHLYAQLVAQSLHLNYRTDGDNGTASLSAKSVAGTIMNSSRARLIQSVPSTRILQALLFTIAACALTSLVLKRDHMLLPASPGSLAARMALIAESRLLKRPGICHADGHTDLVNSEILLPNERLFLGWWVLGDGDGDTEGTGEQVQAGGQYYGIDIVEYQPDKE
ncbi:hypothetical protein GQ53DRAFT_747359 [Thozetella sp. PMI_491]|nr:hypothetical protein GQ53DRAFT_747359 [Thozetella sp. PMI_491]